MNDDTAVYTFERLEQGKDTLTIHFHTENGTHESFTFVGNGSIGTYRIVAVHQRGRDAVSVGEQRIDVYLLKAGEAGVRIFTGSNASHVFSVKLTPDEAWKLARQLSNFMHGRKAKYTPKFEAARFPAYFLQAA